MSLWIGNNLKIEIYGQSHGPLVGVTIEGLPAGSSVNLKQLQSFLDRRAPGQNPWSTARKETDLVEIVCGLEKGVVGREPIEAIIRNTDVKKNDYAAIRNIPRPGHADYTAFVKYKGTADMSGGGQFSGRMTAPLCIAGGIAKQLLEAKGINISAHIDSIGGCHSENVNQLMDIIMEAKAQGDSVGGTIGCTATGIPAGIGGPIFEGLEGTISQLIFAIPAVKGIEFGIGFEAAKIKGSQNNDSIYLDETGQIAMDNNHGGILGGITSGMPLTFRVAIKPTPSIAKEQRSVDLSTMKETTLKLTGRHDPCIVPRALPCVEAALAIAILDRMLDE